MFFHQFQFGIFDHFYCRAANTAAKMIALIISEMPQSITIADQKTNHAVNKSMVVGSTVG